MKKTYILFFLVLFCTTSVFAFPILTGVTSSGGSSGNFVTWGNPSGIPWTFNVNASGKNITSVKYFHLFMGSGPVGTIGSRFISRSSATQYPITVWRNNTQVFYVTNYGQGFYAAGITANQQIISWDSFYAGNYFNTGGFYLGQQLWVQDDSVSLDCTYPGADSSNYFIDGGDMAGYIYLETGSPAANDIICSVFYTNACPTTSFVQLTPASARAGNIVTDTKDIVWVDSYAYSDRFYIMSPQSNPLVGGGEVYAWNYQVTCNN